MLFAYMTCTPMQTRQLSSEKRVIVGTWTKFYLIGNGLKFITRQNVDSLSKRSNTNLNARLFYFRNDIPARLTDIDMPKMAATSNCPIYQRNYTAEFSISIYDL